MSSENGVLQDRLDRVEVCAVTSEVGFGVIAKEVDPQVGVTLLDLDLDIHLESLEEAIEPG